MFSEFGKYGTDCGSHGVIHSLYANRGGSRARLLLQLFAHKSASRVVLEPFSRFRVPSRQVYQTFP
jgi:hypothetical protein